ncbi:MAG TPA: hypothetical protein VD948_10220 [Rhodothermales bacterium]|nr:hypothetical protein [Rhodothermales bacterium]
MRNSPAAQPLTPQPPEPVATPPVDTTTAPTPVLPTVQAPIAHRTSKSQGGSSTKEIVTAEEKAVRGKLSGEMANEEGLVGDLGAAKVALKEEEVDDADRKQTVEHQYRDKTTDVRAEMDPTIADAEADAQRRMEAWRNAKPESFWGHGAEGAFKRVLGGVAIALTGLGNAIRNSGGANVNGNLALDIITNGIERHYAKEQDRIGKLKDVYTDAKGRVVDLRAKKKDLLADAEAWRVEAYRRAELETQKRLAQKGVPVAELENNVVVSQLRQRTLQKEADFLASTREKTTKTWNETYAESDAAGALGGAARGLGIFGAGGKPIGTTGDAKKDATVNEGIAEYRQLRDTLAQLRASYAKGNLMPGSEEAEQRAALAAEAKVLYNSMRAKLGALSGPDAKLIEGVTGGGGAIQLINPGPRVDSGIASLDRAMGKKLEQFGLPATMIPSLIGTAQAAPGASPAPGQKGSFRTGKVNGRSARIYADGYEYVD